MLYSNKNLIIKIDTPPPQARTFIVMNKEEQLGIGKTNQIALHLSIFRMNDSHKLSTMYIYMYLGFLRFPVL